MAENDSSELNTKVSYRRKVWEYLEKNKLVEFPRPCYHRIPNFKNSVAASILVKGLDIFEQSQNIEVNPDKSQEWIRILTLNEKKNLYVPIPRLEKGLLKHLNPDELSRDKKQKLVSRNGIIENGKDISIDDKIKIDLIVLGSVAVSKEGYRIGKGKGFADLEFAILTQMGAVDQNTTIITTVHDSQVFDKIPKELFKEYDVPVDIIVTPTEVIHVEKRLPKPKGIIWNVLSQRRIDMMPVLKLLREQDEKAGKDVTLKEVDSEPETREPQRRRYRNNYRKNRRRQDGDSKSSENQEANDDKENVNNKRPEQRRRQYRKSRNQKSDDADKNTNSEGESKSSRQRSKKNFQKKQIDFSLIVRNIERSMRVRDMKDALNELGVKPRVLTWRGFKGYCCLHFSKNAVNSDDGHNVDHVIGMLQNLKVTPQNNKELAIEVMKPISRIETTDVTAV